MPKLRGKNCLITGAASGIGRSLAIGLAKEEMNLFITDIDMDKLENVKEEIKPLGVQVFTAKCDVSKYEDFVKLADKVYEKFEYIDLLINNAGIGGGSFVENLELEDWKKIFDINLWSVIYSLKVFLPKMLDRGEGHIVNTASGAGVVGLPFHLNYVASKFAVCGITEGLYSELRDRGIYTSAICPTVIKSNIIDKTDIKIPPEILKEIDEKELEEKKQLFKESFWRQYSEGGLTPDQAAKKYIKGIKKRKLYIYDKRILSIAVFLKSVFQGLYKRVLRKQAKTHGKEIENALEEAGIKKDIVSEDKS
jgi:short-subunit dehydrogenase